MNCEILKIVRGNDFTTQMTITALDAGGNVIEDFSLEESTDVVVKYTIAGTSHTIEAYDYAIEGNDITIQWSDLALGKYGFEIEGKFNGYSWRSAARFIFQVVADNASANIPDGVLVNGIYILNDWLRLLSGTGGGGKQVQADWDETDTNSPAYIQNKPDFKTINGESILGEGDIKVGGAVESVNGQTGEVVLDAEDVGAYEKPASGIPATDLDSSVQTALTEVDAFVNGIVEIVADHIAVVNPEPNTIYREQGTTSYTDWMYQNGAWKRLATFDGNVIGYYDDDSTAQLNIGDENGYVIAQFKDGHFRTKFFDSRICADYSNGGYSYVGEKIDVRSYYYKYKYLFTETNSSSSSNQGSDCYGKYLFQFHNTHDTVDIFDMETGNKVQTITLSAVSTYHCNNANFGNEFYDPSDYFPLLYVSQENANVHSCLVYRVTGTEGEWGLTLAQTITFPTPSNDFMWYPNVMIDKANDKFIAAGLGNYPWSSGTDNIIRYKVFPMPKLSDGDITLNVADIENSVELKYYPTAQDGFALNNKIYQVFGLGNNARLLVTDLNSKQVISEIDITANGLQIEPEGCFVYDNTICVNFINGDIYKFDF